MDSKHRYFVGPEFHHDNSVTFRVWAPNCSDLSLRIQEPDGSWQRHAMHHVGHGEFQNRLSVASDARYWLELPDGKLRPDPASRFQPEGVHGPSQLVDTRLFPTENSWRGVPQESLIIYELHVGTFTEEGTYQAAGERLSELADLGITGIELMPIVETAGSRNWGYDGVNLYAPRNSYGSPSELAEFIRLAHDQGIAVILDVVYNHFGPEGNYWHDFGGYISPVHQTPWGDSPNFDAPLSSSMRRFVVENAEFWIRDYGFDGLRLDAIHCMRDTSQPHIVTEIARQVANFRDSQARHIHLIAESNVYDPEMLSPLDQNGHGYDAAWCDDFLHSVFAVLRPGVHMSSREYAPDTDLNAVLQRGFVYRGTLHETRQRIPFNTSATSPHTSAPAVRWESLVYAIQNHDFVGNQPHGKRLHQIVGVEAQRAAAALLLMHPAIPLLFMGEEFAASNGFQFFVDFGDKPLRQAVEQGRKAEYPQHDWESIDSPLSEEAFIQSRIGPVNEGDMATRGWYRNLIALRRRWSVDGLLKPENYSGVWDAKRQLAHLTYRGQEATGNVLIRLHAMGDSPRNLSLPVRGELLLSTNCQQEDSSLLTMHAFGVAIFLGPHLSP
ncbi:MAG: malto-oligosyltrehalose trehalohydrolase [bacterium]|nr:malto-oligosyltrehalose trehalohydrolase [bacterium]